jgi:hypothetical protein
LTKLGDLGAVYVYNENTPSEMTTFKSNGSYFKLTQFIFTLSAVVIGSATFKAYAMLSYPNSAKLNAVVAVPDLTLQAKSKSKSALGFLL